MSDKHIEEWDEESENSFDQDSSGGGRVKAWVLHR